MFSDFTGRCECEEDAPVLSTKLQQRLKIRKYIISKIRCRGTVLNVFRNQVTECDLFLLSDMFPLLMIMSLLSCTLKENIKFSCLRKGLGLDVIY